MTYIHTYNDMTYIHTYHDMLACSPLKFPAYKTYIHIHNFIPRWVEDRGEPGGRGKPGGKGRAKKHRSEVTGSNPSFDIIFS